MDTLASLTHYTCWANRVWLEFTHGKASADPYLARMISHIFLGQKIWFQRIDGSQSDKDVFLTLPIAELSVLADDHQRRYTELCGRNPAEIFRYSKLNGEPQSSSLGDILLHLTTHGAHHRGQMATHASQRNLGVPDTMYITYTRLSPA